jgi:hypothetical protein
MTQSSPMFAAINTKINQDDDDADDDDANDAADDDEAGDDASATGAESSDSNALGEDDDSDLRAMSAARVHNDRSQKRQAPWRSAPAGPGGSEQRSQSAK